MTSSLDKIEKILLFEEEPSISKNRYGKSWSFYINFRPNVKNVRWFRRLISSKSPFFRGRPIHQHNKIL